MSLTVFAAVLGAALLHAVWNALVKGSADKALGMTAMISGIGLYGAAMIPFVPLPDPAAWPYILGSVGLHLGYQYFLVSAYRVGDLTQVYPIARGTAPLLVTGVSVAVLGVDLSRMEVLAVAVIAAGIASLALVRRRDGLRNGKASAFALITGLFIAAYSLVDGVGARAAGNAMSFWAWSALIDAAVFVLLAAMLMPRLVRRLRGVWWLVLGGGAASFASYAIVIWAFTQAPIALVAALRETSIVFALLIGVGLLKERLDLAKVVSTAVTLLGAALMRLAR